MMARPRTTALPPPREYPPNAWVGTADAAPYLRMSPGGLRSAVHRGQLKPDGRGPKGTHMFRVSTLDAYLIDRAQCYSSSRYAAAGDMESGSGKKNGYPNTLPRRDTDRGRAVPTSMEGGEPQNGPTNRSGKARRVRIGHGGRALAGRASNDNAGRVGNCRADASSDILSLLASWQAEDAEAVDT